MSDWAAIEPLLLSLQRELVARRQTVATAESCTGGLVATMLTHLPGSSAIFLGGFAVYANEAKTALLGVDASLLARAGAVSAEVATVLAASARQKLHSTYAVSLTGIAGPDGGRPGKPVGTVYLGFAGPRGASSELLSLSGSREAVRWAAAIKALERIRTAISD